MGALPGLGKLFLKQNEDLAPQPGAVAEIPDEETLCHGRFAIPPDRLNHEIEPQE